jgi:coenzyme F420 hydrogenase subunit beta
MLDFKKRGAFIRLNWRRKMGLRVPAYGYRPIDVPASRKLVEVVISALFLLGRTPLARWLVERIPLNLLGPAFDLLRKAWKGISKPAKRQGLSQTTYEVLDD